MSSTGQKDKWGIPFWYATAADAGVTKSGSGFFWQQNGNIRVDQDKGMVRLGKESDDVEVISTSTGEFEFPFDSGADYFCLELRQGHKSGGESHGCEGSCYIFNVKINQTPAKFFWQKQMFHGGSKFRHNTGEFGHSKVTEKVIGNGWKGFAAVIYGKKDGRSAGHNSAILEIWWNEDPTSDISKWFMVRRIEDKGGWGSGGNTCDGMSDQVITWSNIQFRYKSGTPDFSLHPRKPEFEDGPVIHSIGEEDMSFEDSERRGYGYRADMPANVEMKCLFKFDSNNGICRLKNLSLREIDATKAFDDTPDTPTTGETPGEIQTIQGKFKLNWDLNTNRASACAGVGVGGAGGTSIFYEIDTVEDDRVLTDHVDHDNRTRIGQQVISSTSSYAGKIIKQLDVPLKKAGTPGASPVVAAKIWNPSNGIVYSSATTVDPTTLTTSYTTTSFNFSTNTHVMGVGDRVAIEYLGTSNTNYVIVGVTEVNREVGQRVNYNKATGTWGGGIENSDLVCTMWT